MARSFKVGGIAYGPGRVLVIAEIGTGHGGDRAKARELIAAASESGVDCAKFQCVFADEILHPKTGIVPLPGGDIPLFERFRSLELESGFFEYMKEECEARGLLFLCTPFGLRSARLLRRLGVLAMKVASPELNHAPLLDELSSYGLPTILSSGVSTLGDIARALARFEAPTALLHCVTAYPAPEEDYGLRLLEPLSHILGLPLGVSDHSLDPILVPALSIAVGGTIVEKHICLSRADPGLDDPIALPPEEFKRMVAAIRGAQSRPPQDTLAALISAYGGERIEAVLGSGEKRLAPSEAANYGRTNRSIHAMRDIEKGEAFTEGNVAVLRTEKILRPGLEPELLPVVLSRVAHRGVPSGEGIVWEDVGDIRVQ